MFRNKSPLKSKPLRQTGVPLFTQIHDIVFDKMPGLWIVAALLWSHVVSEWVGYLTEVERNPALYTVVAVAVTMYAAVRAYGLFRQVQDIEPGRRGEKEVSEYLDRLRNQGYRVYDDIPGEHGDIDHVIIGTRGIFVIETRIHCKPKDEDPIVVFDGKVIAVNGEPDDGRPIAKALAQATQLTSILKEQTGQVFSVGSVLIYPGWFVRSQTGSRQSSVSVLNPKSLQQWIEQQADVMPAEQVNLVATALGQLARTAEHKA